MDLSICLRLNFGNQGERFSALDELAEEGTDNAISTLKRVAEGRRLFFFGRDFYDQVYALEHLAALGRKDVNEYIKSFFEMIKYEGVSTTSSDSGVPCSTEYRYSCPNASGRLGSRLSYRGVLTYQGWGVNEDAPFNRDEEAHKIREKLLKKVNGNGFTF